MYSLLNRIENGIKPIVKMFQDHIVQNGIENLMMEAPSIVHDCEKYIEPLLMLFNVATNLVNDAFNGDARFMTARDMVW